jgi:putative ABC transport system ATP-binding protein
MIRLNNIHKSYVMGSNSLHVLKGIDLQIEQGDFVSIMGSSGSGKSTLLNI